MLNKSDLESFKNLIIQRAENPSFSAAATPTLSAALPNGENGIFKAEFWQVRQILHVGFLAGEIPHIVDLVAHALLETMQDDQYAPLSDAGAWTNAIDIALARVNRAEFKTVRKRTLKVAAVYKKLKKERRKLNLDSFGIQWADHSLRDATRQLDGLASLLGGEAIFNQVFAHLIASERQYDEMWLFGETSLSTTQDKEPSLPVGWLLGLAAKHIHKKQTARNPSRAWLSLAALASEITATFDCERYGQFEDMDIPAKRLPQAIEQTLNWHAFFRVQQTHSIVAPILKDAFKAHLAKENGDLWNKLDVIWREFDVLHYNLNSDRCSVIKRREAEIFFPKLLEISLADAGKVNSLFLRPLDETERNDGRYIFLTGPKDEIFVRPRSITNTAFLETIFGVVWKTLPRKTAEKLVGDVLETAVHKACEQKSSNILFRKSYCVENSNNEFDVACRDENEILLLEVKDKNLTRKAESGKPIEFLQDFSNSFLKMIEQLARHEKNIREINTPLNHEGDDGTKLEIEKIALSPLSFGPVSDALFLNAFMRSLTTGELTAIKDDENHKRIVSDFNQKHRKALAAITEALRVWLPDSDMHTFFIFSRWLDISQALYCLSRAQKAVDAFKAFRHLTFVSRDFWTEIAYAERQLITQKYWLPRI